MHVNSRKPNILEDMQAAANGRDLRNRDRDGNPIPKKPKRVYPYQSKRQLERYKR